MIQKQSSILIVEDDSGLREILEGVLVHEGFEVITAIDGGEAVARLKDRTTNFEIVISDFRMPVLDGLALYRYCVETEQSIKRFILISADFSGIKPSDPKFVLLNKPFNTADLMRVIDHQTP